MNTKHLAYLTHLLITSTHSNYFREVLIREATLCYRSIYSESYALTLAEKEAVILDSLGRFREYINHYATKHDTLDTVETTLSKIVSDSYTDTLERSFKVRGLSMV
jgi:hypothetical protein